MTRRFARVIPALAAAVGAVAVPRAASGQSDTAVQGYVVDAASDSGLPNFAYRCVIGLFPVHGERKTKGHTDPLGRFFCVWVGFANADSIKLINSTWIRISGRPPYQTVTDTICDGVSLPCRDVRVRINPIVRGGGGLELPRVRLPWARGDGEVHFDVGASVQFFELGTSSAWPTLVGGAEVWFFDFPLRTSLTVLPTWAGLSTLGGQGDTATYLGEARFDATVAFGSVSHISLGFGLSGGAVGIGDLSGDRTVSGTGDMHAVVLAAIPQRLRLSARLRYVFADRKARNAGYPGQTWVSELGITFRLR